MTKIRDPNNAPAMTSRPFFKLAMRNHTLLLIVSTALLFVGCAHQHPYGYQYVFREEEVGAWRKSIVEAINAPDEWARVAGKRLTDGPIKYYMSETEYNLKCPNGQVEAIVPTSGQSRCAEFPQI